MLKKTISITPAPARSTVTAARRQQSTQPLPANLELLKTNLALWQELTDEAFERHFRQRYFGNESISRQQAIDRLVSSGFEHLQSGALCGPAAESRLHDRVNGFPHWGPAYFTASPISPQLSMLPAGQPRWPSLLLSLLTHGLILSLLLSVQISQRRNRLIDFDTETITYYKMSDSSPNVAPIQRKEFPDSSPAPSPRAVDFRSNQEVQIRPTESQQSEIVIDQPNLRQMPALPKLQLPNILLHTSKMDPGRAPLVVPAEVLRHLELDVQPPLSLGNLPQNSTKTLATRHNTLPLPQLAEPAEPASAALPVTPIGLSLDRLGQRAAQLPYAAPPLEEDSPVGFQVEAIAAQGPDLLVFSASPAIHKAEIRVPRARSLGRLTASSTEAAPSVLAPEVVELGHAEIVMPSISISNRTASTVANYGTAVVQAPPPKPPVLPPPSPTRASSLLDFLPSRIPSSKPLASIGREIGSGVSPLRDYEGRGGPVYTAAINAPNFTSKRGSWIFRFAELSAAEPASSATAPASPLTAPSAIVKVDPKYAPEAVREKLEGVVILYAILRKDGSIDGESVRVVRKLDSRLDLSARDALLNWKFKPSQKNGVAVDIQMEVSIPFYFRRDGL